MAVAVKNAPGTSATSAFVRPAYVSLLGALYVIVALGVVFKGLPALAEALGFRTSQIIEGTLLGLAMLATAACAIFLGGRLLGRSQEKGVRAGIFVGFVSFLVVLGLTRWASIWIEHGVYHQHWFGAQGTMWGPILTGVVGLLLLAGTVWCFVHPWTQALIVRFEEGGWFHATGYKPLQGLRVRRATIFGLIVLVGAGIYTLISHGTLSRGASDWYMDIPFTGTMSVTALGDAKPWLETAVEQQKAQVRVFDAGKSGLPARQLVRADVFKKSVQTIVETESFQNEAKSTHDLLVKASEGNVLDLLVTINEQLTAEIKRLVDSKELGLNPDVVKNLRAKLDTVQPADVTPVLSDFKKQVAQANKTNKLTPVFDLPTGLLVLDRFTLRDINEETNPSRNVKIAYTDDSEPIELNGQPLRIGEVVKTSDLDAAVDAAKDRKLKRIESLRTSNPEAYDQRKREILREFKEPTREDLAPAEGKVQYMTLTLMPAVPFTLPLLLLAATLWLSWRVVNMPAFADFLIATEAEVNKVSWTTQRRLVQDTIVVLATVVLMAGYLFAVDQIWRVSLSWEYIKVLQIPKEQSDVNRSVEQKNW